MKDGCTHLATKDEHAVNPDTGTIVALTVPYADIGDFQSLPRMLAQAEQTLVVIRNRMRASSGRSPVGLL